MAEYDFHFTAEVMDSIFGEVIEARGAWDTLGDRLDNIEGGGGTSDYSELTNKPTINSVELDGDKTSADLGLQPSEAGKGLSTNDFTDDYLNGLKDIVDSGAKNRIKVDAIGTTSTSGASYTSNGTTFTLNADGSITCSGDNDNTADSSVRLLFDSAYFNAAPYCTGEYILSGSPSDASDSTYFCSCYGSSYNYKDTGNGIVLPSTATTSINVYITVKKGKSADGKTFYPMICRKAAYDVSKVYKPYVPSNEELYAMIQAL